MKVTGRTYKNGLLFRFYQGRKFVDWLCVDYGEMKDVDRLVSEKRKEYQNGN